MADALPTLVDLSAQEAAIEIYGVLKGDRVLRDKVLRALRRDMPEPDGIDRDYALHKLAIVGFAYAESVHEARLARRRKEENLDS